MSLHLLKVIIQLLTTDCACDLFSLFVLDVQKNYVRNCHV